MSTTKSSSSSKSMSSDIVTNLSNLLPTGTFLAFQTIAPLFTNNGHCHNVEKIMTGILVLTFSAINFLLSFTDSLTTSSGKHYYGLVTTKGLYNPQFHGSAITNVSGSFYTGNRRYFVSTFDFINGVLGVVVFGVLVLLTPPVSTCYYPNVPTTIVKSVPVLVGIIASMYFSFAPPPRRGVGYSIAGLIPESVDEHDREVPDSATAHSVALPVLSDQESNAIPPAKSPV